jgi:hypothetical protein
MEMEVNELNISHRQPAYRPTTLRHPHAREAAIAEWFPSAPWGRSPRPSEGGDAALLQGRPGLIGAGFIIFFQLLMLWMLAQEVTVSARP